MPGLTGIVLGKHGDGSLDGDASLELVAASTAHGPGPTMWHAWQTRPSGRWTGWHRFGQPGRGDPGRPSIIQHPTDGRLEVFVVTSGDQAVWHRWHTGPGLDRWSDWESLGKPDGRRAEGPVALTFLPDGRIMAVVTAGGAVWQATSPGPEPQAQWPAWSSLGRPGGAKALAVAAAANADGRVELAALGAVRGASTSPKGIEGKLSYRRQTDPGADKWSDWEPLGQPGGHHAGIPVFQIGEARSQLFTRAADGAVWRKSQGVIGDADSWGPWEALAQPVMRFGDIAVELDATGRLFLVATQFAGNLLWYASQAVAATNTWCPLSPLALVPGASQAPGALTSPALSVDTDGRMQLFVVMGAAGKLYQLSATAPGQLPSVGRTWPGP
jgi:hypothetical protein